MFPKASNREDAEEFKKFMLNERASMEKILGSRIESTFYLYNLFLCYSQAWQKSNLDF